MKFFTAIYPGDPRFHDYLSPSDFNYGYLYSISNFNPQNIMRHFSGFTGDVMIDSGSFRFVNHKKLPISQKEAILKQIRIAKKLSTANRIIICHLDFPLKIGGKKREMEKRIDITLQNAIEFKSLFDAFASKTNIYSLGIIQGYDEESIKSSFQLIKDLGFDFYGLGGLAKLVQTAEGKWKIALQRIQHVIKLLGNESKKLHIFGVNNLKILREIWGYGTEVHSVDSSSPIKGAFNSRVFINGIQKDFRKMDIREINCSCPVCREMSNMIFMRGKKVYNNIRAVHNLYDLLTTLNNLIKNKS